MTETKHFDTEAAIKAQRDYCDRKGAPYFAPLYDGRCFSCYANIFAAPHGISVEEAGSRLITGCPYCGRTYVD